MSYFNSEWINEYLSDTSKLIIFDVGSRIGEVGIYLKNKFPDSRVICIEADKKFHDEATKRHFPNIETYNYAVCDIDGEYQFYSAVGKLSGIGSIHPPTEKLYAKASSETKILDPIPIKATRIDSFCLDHGISEIDVLHMDIQSAEYKALVGLGNLRPRLIFLEISQENGKDYQYIPPQGGTEKKLNEMGYEKILRIKGDELWKYKL